MGCFKSVCCIVHSLLQVIANTAKVDVTDKPLLSSNGKGAAKLYLDLSRELVAHQGKERGPPHIVCTQFGKKYSIASYF